MVHGWPRYKDAGTLKLLLESLDRFAPWADVYLVVAMPSQVPDYVDKKKVRIIYHKDFIPESIGGCVFQSNAIESFIGRMNLPERFVWMNDDIVFLHEVNEEKFFGGDIPKHTFSFEKKNKNFWSYGWNVSNFQLLFQDAEPKVLKTQHGPTPLRMSWCREMYERYEDRIMSSVGSVVERQDGQINQLAYSLYQYWYKSTFESTMSGVCVNPHTRISNALFDNDWICINENTKFDSSNIIRMTGDFLHGKVRRDKTIRGRLIKRF